MFEIGSLLTKLDAVQIRLFSWRKGIPVGTDSFGNRYFRGRRPRYDGRERRWVMYNGAFEASKVPPEWYGWLHHTDNLPGTAESPHQKPWMKPHLANQSGTAAAYRPPGHPVSGGQRPKVAGDYEPWQPV
ncbi:MAG: NADH:ubiquinone oxidoreductase subunit NDUFA12 [Rhodospirillaceae bacterium]